MYLDSPEDKYQSYYYQVEECHGIFEESVIFQENTSVTGDGYIIITRLPGYEIQETMEIVYPIFEGSISEHVRSGKNMLKKHDLIGYANEKKVKYIEDEVELRLSFWEETRERVASS